MSFTVPLPPRTQLYHRSCSNKHTLSRGLENRKRGFLTLGKLRETNWKPFEGDASLSFLFQTKFGVFPVGTELRDLKAGGAR